MMDFACFLAAQFPFFWSLNVLAANYSQAGQVTAVTRRIWRKVLFALRRSWAIRYEKGDPSRIGDGIFFPPLSSLERCNVNLPPTLLCRGWADLPPRGVSSWPLACRCSFDPLAALHGEMSPSCQGCGRALRDKAKAMG